MKKGLGLVLAVCLFASTLASPVMAKGGSKLPFTDVPENSWFHDDVAYAYSIGLINGKSDDEYMPDDKLTYAEAVKLAACMNQYYTEGEVTLKPGELWYESFVEYCNDNGIIKKGYSWDKSATRAGYMEIFANSLPSDALQEINYVEDGSIPDVKSDAEYYDAVYKLYRAGIVTGVDDEHNCNPAENIKRSEVAAIITRMMSNEARVEFTMGDPNNKDKDKDEDNTDKDKDSEEDADKDKDETDKDTETTERLTVTPEPATVEVSVGDEVTVKVVATGGKAPYTYDWHWYGRAVRYFKEVSYNPLDDEDAKNAGFNLIEQGDDGSLTFKIESRKAENLFPKIWCKVTDADGNYQTAEFKIIYLGSGLLNDLASNEFCMYVEDKYTIESRGVIATGRIENGSIKVGDELRLLRRSGEEKTVTVEGIEMFRKKIDSAEKGDNVGLLLGGLGETIDEAKKNIERGDALVGVDTALASSNSVLVEIKMLTKAEGGRITAAKGDGTYKLQAYFGNSDTTVTLTNYVYDEENGEWLNPDFTPGETYSSVYMDLTGYRFIYVGQEGTIREGGKNVGTFKVLEVY